MNAKEFLKNNGFKGDMMPDIVQVMEDYALANVIEPSLSITKELFEEWKERHGDFNGKWNSQQIISFALFCLIKYKISYQENKVTDEQISKKGIEIWEEDQKTNPESVNPHAFLYGFKACAKWMNESKNRMR